MVGRFFTRARSAFVLALSVVILIGLVVLPVVPATPAAAATLPTGFQDNVVLSGLSYPTAMRFAPDGRVFVGEQSGLIKVFDNLSDTTPTVFADLRTNVMDYWDRGMLGIELDPQFPTRPYVYALYTYDAPPGGTAPAWGDFCANGSGGTCVVQSRLSRLTASGNQMTGPEQVLIEGWCQQFPSHTTGTVLFGNDGALYASAGEGASFDFVESPSNTGWRTVALKERPGGLAYSLYSSNGSRPNTYVNTGGSDVAAVGSAALPTTDWSHLASAYDGSMLRLYVNGTQVDAQPVSGSLVTTTGALRIGGNAVWGEYFSGLIDEVRVYNRALSAAEVATDMSRPV